MACVMTVYSADRVAIGHVQDFGPGRVLAHVREPDGKFRSIGFLKDRQQARLAVEAAAGAPSAPIGPEAA